MARKRRRTGSAWSRRSRTVRRRALDSERLLKLTEKALGACGLQGRVDIVVATDVASRGLDVLDIEHVIQYDLPDTIEDYTHRVGASRYCCGCSRTIYHRSLAARHSHLSREQVAPVARANLEAPRPS